MIKGVGYFLGKMVAATRGLTKIAIGVNPAQPLDIRQWLAGNFLGNSHGPASVNSARADHSNDSIMDQMTRSQVQQATRPAPQTSSK